MTWYSVMLFIPAMCLGKYYRKYIKYRITRIAGGDYFPPRSQAEGNIPIMGGP